MSQRRDLIILLLLFVALVVFTLLGPARSSKEEQTDFPTTHSSAPGGTLALLRWANDMGYQAQRLEYTQFEVNEQDDALFIISPSEPVNRTHSTMVLDWVEQGGTLILVEDRMRLFGGNNQLLNDLNIDVELYEGNTIGHAIVLQPMLNTPPLSSTIPVHTDYVLATSRNNVAPLLGSPPAPEEEEAPPEETNPAEDLLPTTEPVLFGVTHGKGYIYICSASFPFTNKGLRHEENAALVLNLLRRVPPGGRILFDEWHNGYFTPPSLRSIMIENSWGQAIIYALVVLAIYMLMTGRRFGRPVPLRDEVALRSSAEYVENMADLFQRSKKRDFILHHYYTAFKRRIARPYGVNPRMDDDTFLAELSHATDLDTEHLRAILGKLRQQKVSEAELLAIIAEADNETRPG